MNLVAVVGAIAFPILERIPIFGDFAVSPHGLGIAVGFTLGAMLMTRRAVKRGLGHVHVSNINEAVQELLIRAAIGAIIGARFFYVVTHVDQFQDDPIRVLFLWEGGLTFLGGVTGAILLAIPYARSRGWRMSMLLDSAAPGIALGLAVGRIGDLMIGDHIGAPTDFPLAWKCTANHWVRATNSFGTIDPLPYPVGGVQPTAGCFDVAVHHTAMYDFGATIIVLLVLLMMERRRWFDGAFIAAWVWVYGALRITSDFARNDRTFVGLTGSQWSLVGAMLLVAGVLLVTKPWRRQRWSWDLVFDHPWMREDFDAEGFVHEQGPLLVGAGLRARGAHAVMSAATIAEEIELATPDPVASTEMPVAPPSLEREPEVDGRTDGSLMEVPPALFGDRPVRPDAPALEMDGAPDDEPVAESSDGSVPESSDEPDESVAESPDEPWSVAAALESSVGGTAPKVGIWDPPALAPLDVQGLQPPVPSDQDVEFSNAPASDGATPDAAAPDAAASDAVEPTAEPERRGVWEGPAARPRPQDPAAGPRMARKRDHRDSGV